VVPSAEIEAVAADFDALVRETTAGVQEDRTFKRRFLSRLSRDVRFLAK
jgi:hypothetical protein